MLISSNVCSTGSNVCRWVYELTHLFKLRKLKLQRQSKSRPVFRAFDEHRCVFIHIPKCAGISISNSLFQGNTPHLTLECYQSLFTPSEFSSYFKFTVVRNPWDRVVSAYHYLNAGGRTPKDRRWVAKNLSCYPDFESFVKHGLTRSGVRRYLHFRPQSEFICTARRRTPLDFIALFENLEDDFLHVCRKLNVSTTLKKLNLTLSRKKDFKDYYTEETRQIVADVYAEDLANLGYSFDNSSVPEQLKLRSARIRREEERLRVLAKQPGFAPNF